MTNETILKQKQAGLILMILGLFLLALISAYFYFRSVRIKTFTDVLPSRETVAYVEFPVQINDAAVRILNGFLNTDWNKDVLPWAREKAGFALISGEPVFMIRVKSETEARNFLKIAELQPNTNGSSTISETSINSRSYYFLFIYDALFISPSKNAIGTIKEHSSTPASLSGDQNFSKIRKNIDKPIFSFFRWNELPKEYFKYLGDVAGRMPFLTFASKNLGIGLDYDGTAWHGVSYVLFDKVIAASSQEKLYRASLLGVLPPDFEVLFSGQDLGGQLDKIDAVLKDQELLPDAGSLVNSLLNEYLPNISVSQIGSLAADEFALTIDQNKFLFVSELNADPATQKNIDEMRKASKLSSGKFSPMQKEVTLPDGTVAAELFPSPQAVTESAENFEGASIHGIISGAVSIYDSTFQNKLFISNDLSTLKKSVLLAKGPGLSFRETQIYRQFLQPILKNPELAGISIFKGGKFGFSKRMFTDRMEVNFVLIEN